MPDVPIRKNGRPRDKSSGTIAAKILKKRNHIPQGLAHFLNNACFEVIRGDPLTSDQAGLDTAKRLIIESIVYRR